MKPARKRTGRSWDAGTWQGARNEQLRRWGQLTLREKLEAVEAMGQLAARFAELRRRSSRKTAPAT